MPAARPSGEALTGALERLVAAGLGRREAVLAVEVLLGVARREAYQAALALGPLDEGHPGPDPELRAGWPVRYGSCPDAST